jgi:REP element-mobilizing transposase RayT
MPEHFHFPIKPEPAESSSRLLQELKKRTAQRVVSVLPFPSLRIASGWQPTSIPHWPCGGTESCGRRESGAP